ncbi:UPF0496 protein 1 [Hordeum vulgare subsp. vulgare]|uniref:Uncharacterized protein n=1 Tax=Hordeum vulgare subsp. vulgare TaxID=112509 RepID=M0UQZ2_HORVV|nr:UPF0496 protein 1 [Hordeum vulgare subsp. vulgare]XP_044982574.1 UPF0496 protein 1 [Hordeum vulgare subsp. vulgare]KAI4993099.1 hypothetical protein ZWY2020_007412 [Hordeum vulgare]
MGNNSSSSAGGSRPHRPTTSSEPGLPHAAAAEDLSSYEAACRHDPEVRTFDSTLQRRTSRAISTLAVGVEVRSMSLDSLREVTGCLLDMNQEVVKVILDCKKDIWKSPELFDLVEDYFESSLHTLDFCTALDKCLKRARDSQLLLHVALQRFDDEDDNDGEAAPAARYARTLHELRQFKAAGDPFTDEFFEAFQAVYRQQLAMLEKLQQRKHRLDKKIKTIKAWRRVSSVIFASTFAAVLICSVVAAAIAAPPVAAALAAAAAIPIGSMGKWIDSLLKGYQDAVRGQKEVVSAMQVGTFIAIKDLDNIRVLISRVEMEISSMIDCVDFAERDEEAVKFGVEEIKKKLEAFMKSVEDLGEQADRCSRDIRRARTVVLQRIIRPN